MSDSVTMGFYVEDEAHAFASAIGKAYSSQRVDVPTASVARESSDMYLVSVIGLDHETVNVWRSVWRSAIAWRESQPVCR